MSGGSFWKAFSLPRSVFTAAWLSLVPFLVTTVVLCETDSLEEALAVELLATVWRLMYKRNRPSGPGKFANAKGQCRGACWCLPTFSEKGIDLFRALAAQVETDDVLHPVLSCLALEGGSSVPFERCISRADVRRGAGVLARARLFQLALAHLTGGCFKCGSLAHMSRSARPLCSPRPLRKFLSERAQRAQP